MRGMDKIQTTSIKRLEVMEAHKTLGVRQHANHQRAVVLACAFIPADKFKEGDHIRI